VPESARLLVGEEAVVVVPGADSLGRVRGDLGWRSLLLYAR
jgi:hypothetical protein